MQSLVIANTEGKVLFNIISFYDKITYLADQGKPVDGIFLDFSKAFCTAACSIPYKMSNMQLEKYVMQCVNNWLTG